MAVGMLATVGCSSDEESGPTVGGDDILVTVSDTNDSTSDGATADVGGSDDVEDTSAPTQPLEWTLDPGVPPTAIAGKRMERFSGFEDPAAGHHIYFCGEGGVFRLRDASGTWIDRDLQTSDTINYCHAVGTNVMAAVGDTGKVWRWSGQGWGSNDLLTSSPNLRGVWVTSPSGMYVVGVAGTIARLDNQAWNDEFLSGETGTVEAIWGADADTLFATGDNLLLRRTGGQWVRDDLPDGQDFGGKSIWGIDADNVWAVGNGGRIAYRGSDGVWTIQDSQWFGTAFVEVWGDSTENVWAMALKGMVRRWDGATWTIVDLKSPLKTPEGEFWPASLKVPSQNALDYVGVYTVSDDEIYIFTSDGQLVTYGDDYVL